MKMKISLALLLGSMVASTALSAQSTPAAALLALSKKDHTLAIVDPATLRVIAKVPVGNDPHEVIASADGSTAYISNYGFGAYNTLAVVDLDRTEGIAGSRSWSRCEVRMVWILWVARCGLPPKARRRLAATILPRRKSIGSWAPVKTEPT